jgi:hypothetical protein
MNFDLNLNNYKINELEEMFGLPNNNYDLTFIETKTNNLRDSIMQDHSILPLTKNKTVAFIDAAKELLKKQTKNIDNLKKISDADIYSLNHQLKTSNTTDSGNTFIIDKPPTPYGQSSPSEFYSGVINPLKKRVLKQNLNIDTRFRSNYYTTQSTNFHFDLPIKFSNILSMQLSAFEFPTTAYAISKQFGNHYFWISASDNNGENIENASIIIPDGNYTPGELVLFINNYITSDPGPFANYSLLKNLVFALNTSYLVGGNSGSGQIMVGISTTSSVSFSFSLNFQADLFGNPDYSNPLPLKLGWMLGFREGYYKNNLNYVSEGIADTKGPNYLYLVIDDYNNNVNNSFYSAFNSSILNKNILARISLQSNTPFSTIVQNNLNLVTTARQYFGPVDIQKMHIQLLDEYGRIVNLNNMDFSFCISFQSVYDL